jgi:alpha-mannosidase
VFIGLGNHGGGPSQRMVGDVRDWAAAHPEFEVRFAGLSSFFSALRRELAGADAPKLEHIHGEVNYCLRGCYASVARFKHGYRRAEQELLRAERTTALLQDAGLAPASDLSGAWQSILFNSFHDILPGSSIERAFDEQIDEVSSVRHTVRDIAFRALNHLASHARITLPAVGSDHPKAVPFLVWNPLLRPVRTFVEIEACLDFRFIEPYKSRVDELPMEVRIGGRRAPFQVIATESESFSKLAWRKRVLVPMALPAAGWNLVSLGWVEGSSSPAYPRPVTGKGQLIRNSFYEVSVRPGARGIDVRHRGRSLFGPRGLHLTTVADKWGSWGSFGDEPESYLLTREIGRWRVSRAAVIESGPLRAALAVRLTARRAHADLTLRLSAGVEEVEVEVRVFTDLEAARIMLVLPGARTVECEVPAERVRRTTAGEMPVLRWLRAREGRHGFALASDVLSAFNLNAGDLRVTMARATRYARVETLSRSKEWWRPTVDRGELRERLILLPLAAPVPDVADQLTQPPIATLAWENPAGTLPASGSIAALTPSEVRVLALKPGPDGTGLDVRVQNLAGLPVRPVLRLGVHVHRLGRIQPGEIATFRFAAKARGRPRRVALGR